MLAELVFMTRLLGLAFGEQEIVLRASDDIKRVVLRRDSDPIATITAPPWRARINLGREVAPFELTAIGLDARGIEVARDTQVVNLSRPRAEVGILLDRNGDRLQARVLSTHVLGRKPDKTVVKLDGRVVSRKPVADLGIIKGDDLHVVSAEVTFTDRIEARKDVVFGGKYTEQMPAQLTAVAVRQRSGERSRCIRIRGDEVEPVAIEKGKAIVAFVVNNFGGYSYRPILESRFRVDDAQLSIVIPILRTNADAAYFDTYPVRSPRTTAAAIAAPSLEQGERRYAEAIATAGQSLLRGERRRVIVYVIGRDEGRDPSLLSPAVVRRYLQRIGVPLRVWSLAGPRPDLAESWGTVQDVSSPALLEEATADLRAELATQRIAWLPGEPLDVFRSQASSDCTIALLSTP